MTKVPWLELTDSFPSPELALESPNGLLAAGADLSSERLIEAYRSGIFPWYEDGQPLLWWSPDPRAVLNPESLRITRSLRKRLKRNEFDIFINRNFSAVVEHCAAPRSYADDTWITDEMFDAYCLLHEKGFAHSFEAYQNDQLVGGLYGICIGNLFCGESMFHKATDASKVVFAHLARFMEENGSKIIDCQLENDHLMSLGCELIPRQDYLRQLQMAQHIQGPDWMPRQLVYDWNGPIITL